LARAQHARGFAKMSSRRKPGSSSSFACLIPAQAGIQCLGLSEIQKEARLSGGFFLAPSADLLPVRKALDSGLASSAVVELSAGMTTP